MAGRLTERAIAQLEGRVAELIAPFHESVARPTTIPGVSHLVAHVLVAEVGLDMSRFPSPAHLRSWAGLCPRLDESAGKRRSTRLRLGAPWLKTTLVQAAWAAVKVKQSYFRAQFLRLRTRRGPKRAIVAADGSASQPLAGSAAESALASGPGADRVRTSLLQRVEVPPRTTAVRFLVHPPGAYREARVTIEDVETEESDGFVTAVE